MCVFGSGRRGPGGAVEYRVCVERVLHMLRYPRYIYTAKSLYGDTGELIVEEILQRGQMTMSCAVKTVADRLTHNMEGETVCLCVFFNLNKSVVGSAVSSLVSFKTSLAKLKAV